MLRFESRHEENQCFDTQTESQHEVSTRDVGQFKICTDHNHGSAPTIEVAHKGFKLSRNEELLEFAKFFFCHDNCNLKDCYFVIFNLLIS